jgi:hypothetical protein
MKRRNSNNPLLSIGRKKGYFIEQKVDYGYGMIDTLRYDRYCLENSSTSFYYLKLNADLLRPMTGRTINMLLGFRRGIVAGYKEWNGQNILGNRR